eukprot:NODE_573_length_1341_cov_184.983746_g394_i1.p2 GENE.NODE_573_length_1341_cov_184.983746_g394_i1~~NODE_573_length_1341_cov_184.983746_g394_i1.p2  ORF type:complete len:226 (+),score=28.15 NODE_573_length_1341_cov_184.983746_g394_i1:443-1120(+)
MPKSGFAQERQDFLRPGHSFGRSERWQAQQGKQGPALLYIENKWRTKPVSVPKGERFTWQVGRSARELESLEMGGPAAYNPSDNLVRKRTKHAVLLGKLNRPSSDPYMRTLDVDLGKSLCPPAPPHPKTLFKSNGPLDPHAPCTWGSPHRINWRSESPGPGAYDVDSALPHTKRIVSGGRILKGEKKGQSLIPAVASDLAGPQTYAPKMDFVLPRNPAPIAYLTG